VDLSDRERSPQSTTARWVLRALYHSKVYLLLRKTLINAGLAGQAAPQRLTDPAWARTHRVPAGEFRSNLEEMFTLCRQRGMGSTLLVLPRNPSRQTWFEGYRDTMLVFRQTPGVQVLDVFLEWRQASDAALFVDELHPNARGHERLAAAVAASLRDNVPTR
jgi:lysophospholipase L1-like esterase